MIRSGGGQLSFDDLMDTEVGFKKRREGGRRRRREPGSRCAPGMGRRGGNETDRQYAGAVPNLRLWRTGAAARERGGRYRPGTSVTDQTGSMGDTPLSCPPGGGHGVDGDGSHEGTAALRGGLGSEAVHGDRAVRPVRR